LWRVDPFLYPVVRFTVSPAITPPRSGVAFVTRRTFLSKPPGFFQRTIQYVILDALSDWPTQEMVELLQNCTGIIGLASLITTPHSWLLPVLGQIHVQRLYILLAELFDDLTIDLTHPMFSSVTHFDVFDSVDSPRDPIHGQLSLLPALTHLCLNNHVPFNVLRTVLRDCRTLRVLANLFSSVRRDNAEALARNIPLQDPRFVVVLWEDYWADWERGAGGRKDFWARADDFVEQKLNGEIAGRFPIPVPIVHKY
jgi:hypothetical protein